MNGVGSAILQEAFGAHERFLWGLCYRMTGSAADADDLVQDTFVRAMEKPPPRTEEPWRPWLVTVALNLSRDHLRRRRRQPYRGPWLPAPADVGEDDPPSYEPLVEGNQTTEGRYDLMESVSYAFLLALEALTPAQRAVLLLRDVFDYSVRETSGALAMSEANVKTTHHRARRAMKQYEKERSLPTAEARRRHQQALEQFVSHLVAQDVASLEQLLAEDVVALSDGGGVFHAALKPILGRSRVLRFFLSLARRRGPVRSLEWRDLNGLPALLCELADDRPHEASRFVMRCDLDPAGRMRQVHTILAPDKLAAIRFGAS